MRVIRIVQAAGLMLIVALAASCAASKEYSSKLFKPATGISKDSQAVVLRFLELDKLDADKADWVTTDIIMGRDTANPTAALDNLAKTFPAGSVTTKDKNAVSLPIKETNEQKTLPAEAETKPAPVTIDTKPAPVIEQPVAKNYNTGSTRNKKTREEK